MNIKARLSNGTVLDLTVDTANCTVKDLKEIINTSSGEPVLGMRLVYRGRILQNDDEQLKTCNIEENEIVHVAKPKASSPSTPKTPVKPAFDMSSMMENPLVESMLSNPAILQSMLAHDPRFKKLTEVSFFNHRKIRN